MDEIPFEKVSVDEARRALQAEAVKNTAICAVKKDWKGKRTTPAPDVPDLHAQTFKWLASLPKEVRPNGLARQYPRVANRMAELWKRPIQCERYLDELMIDFRGDRKGFPPDIAAEVAALKMHFLRTARIFHFGIWGNRISVD